MNKPLFLLLLTLIALGSSAFPQTPRSFEIGKESFLLDGKPIVIRCGEMHATRVPREYWRDRLRRLRAMGMNAVCAYLFWNFHEWEEGKYDWTGQADIAEFCRLAQEEGLWVVLRPGPYACAEWEMGGLPWWLLRQDGIELRSRDPKFMNAASSWIREVGRVLGPLQVSKGGPILMVQVENEYGFYGSDKQYMKELYDATVAAGFNVPLFACNPVGKVGEAKIPELFSVVNFGSDPFGAFNALRKAQPEGPLMCGEFYPGWFDTWGFPHHTGKSDGYLADLEYMLQNKASFSIYMAHGGSSFGLWSGADTPFKPDTSSYDYDAPISEAGWMTEKFHKTRKLMSRYLEPGETLPEPPDDLPVMEVAPFSLTEFAPLLANLPTPVQDVQPRNMEAYNQSRGCTLYRTTLPAGPAVTLQAAAVGDFGFVYLAGTQVGVLDRRKQGFKLTLPERSKAVTLDILVEAMGRVNFGRGVYDRKGLRGPVTIAVQGQPAVPVETWQIFPLDLNESMLRGIAWEKAPGKSPGFWKGKFTAENAHDTFLDVRNWGKGVLWINGRCLGRFWNIGPTQTMFVPGPWLNIGENEVVIFDLTGPTQPMLAGLKTPILNELRPELDFQNPSGLDKGKLLLDALAPVFTGQFPDSDQAQTAKFDRAVEARQVCFEFLDAQDGKPFAVVAELDLLDAEGKSISHAPWRIVYADSEECSAEDGSAANAINGQTSDFWHSTWSTRKAPFPHRLIIDLGSPAKVAGVRYTPRPGMREVGRVKRYKIYAGERLVEIAE